MWQFNDQINRCYMFRNTPLPSPDKVVAPEALHLPGQSWFSVFGEGLQGCLWEGFPLALPASGMTLDGRESCRKAGAGRVGRGAWAFSWDGSGAPHPCHAHDSSFWCWARKENPSTGGMPRKGGRPSTVEMGWATWGSRDQQEPLRHPRFYVLCSSCKALFTRCWSGAGAGGKFTIHWTWLKVSINISMSGSNSIVPLACGAGFPLKALKSWVLLC